MKIVNRRSGIIMLLITGLIFAGTVVAADSIFSKGLDFLRKKPEATQSMSGVLSNADITAGLKEVLSVGTEKVVSQLGRNDGFNADPAIHIPLPDQMDSIKSVLGRVGLADPLDDLEEKLNRAAESAMPVTRDLFLDSVRDMSIADATAIYKGKNDAATRYFRQSMTPELQRQMTPIVDAMLAQVGAVGTLDKILQSYNALPLVPRQELNLNNYVVEKAMDGMFFYMAKEEAAIRENPVARTTDLLKRVFGAL